MPKIIKDVKKRLLAEAKKQIEDVGYSATTIRSVADACGVSVGTVYNYYASKDDLLAAYMLADWAECLIFVSKVSEQSEKPEPVLRSLYEQLVTYADRHRSLFRDRSAADGFAVAYLHFRSELRTMVAAPLRKFCATDFEAEFAADALMSWFMAHRSFEEIFEVLQRIF